MSKASDLPLFNDVAKDVAALLQEDSGAETTDVGSDNESEGTSASSCGGDSAPLASWGVIGMNRMAASKARTPPRQCLAMRRSRFLGTPLQPIPGTPSGHSAADSLSPKKRFGSSLASPVESIASPVGPGHRKRLGSLGRWSEIAVEEAKREGETLRLQGMQQPEEQTEKHPAGKQQHKAKQERSSLPRKEGQHEQSQKPQQKQKLSKQTKDGASTGSRRIIPAPPSARPLPPGPVQPPAPATGNMLSKPPPGLPAPPVPPPVLPPALPVQPVAILGAVQDPPLKLATSPPNPSMLLADRATNGSVPARKPVPVAPPQQGRQDATSGGLQEQRALLSTAPSPMTTTPPPAISRAQCACPPTLSTPPPTMAALPVEKDDGKSGMTEEGRAKLRSEILAQARREKLPLKVRVPEPCVAPATMHLDKHLPAKKRPAFAEVGDQAIESMKSLDSNLPVKMRVSKFLLEDAHTVLAPQLLPSARANSR